MGVCQVRRFESLAFGEPAVGLSKKDEEEDRFLVYLLMDKETPHDLVSLWFQASFLQVSFGSGRRLLVSLACRFPRSSDGSSFA